MADDRYLGAIPRDDPRAHLGPLPTEPIGLPTAEQIDRRHQRLAQQAVAEEWLAATIRAHLLRSVGHGPRLRGTFLPLNSVPAWVDQEGDELVFEVRMGEYPFEVAVRRL